MTEHSAVIFVFFFLAEYASIVLMCILNSVLFLGGYLYNYLPLYNFLLELFSYIDVERYIDIIINNELEQYAYYEEKK